MLRLSVHPRPRSPLFPEKGTAICDADARTATAMLAHGRLQRQDNVIHVLDARSRDFR
jgi:hypothetical protein